MAQRLTHPSSVPQTHDAQQEQDQRDSARLFLNSVDRLVEGDADLSQEETATLLSSTQDAAGRMGAGEDQDTIYVNIADELKCIANQVDSVVDHYDGFFQKILEKEDSDAMTEAFLQVGAQVFRDGITTQRIAVLLLFSYKLVKLFLRKMREKVSQLLGSQVTNFIVLAGKFLFAAFVKYQVLSWVRLQGGWQNLTSSWTSLALTVVGVALIGFAFASRFWKSS